MRLFFLSPVVFLFGTLLNGYCYGKNNSNSISNSIVSSHGSASTPGTVSGLPAAPALFKLHLINEPSTLDPQKQKASSSNYLLGNLFRNIYRFDDEKGLVFDLGKSCLRKSTLLICQLRENLKWSDGKPLTADDFIRTYKKLINPDTAAPRADLLFSIRNAKEIYTRKKPIESLGIKALNPTTVQFDFIESDPEFEYELGNFILAPTREDLNISSGPYKIKEWKKTEKLVLQPNLNYHSGHPQRPTLEYLFIAEDAVALQLFEKHELQLLRRLPTIFIPKYEHKKEFHWVQLSRFDYIGFGPELNKNESLRKSFIYSLNFEELQKIFYSKGRPGCVGLPDSWFPQKSPCYDFDLKKISKPTDSRTFVMSFSSLGGEDHRRGAEWMQEQWQKNAGLKIQLIAKENKIFQNDLIQAPTDLFRKGAPLDHPTCLHALSIFSEISPENFIRLKSSEYEKILKSLRSSTQLKQKKLLCQQGVEYLMSHFLLIPTGPIHLAILTDPNYAGWKLNQMNQLDLSELHFIR